jgi:hypothetical protein
MTLLAMTMKLMILDIDLQEGDIALRHFFLDV